MSLAVDVTTSPSKKLQVLAISFSSFIVFTGIYLCWFGTEFGLLRLAIGLSCSALGATNLLRAWLNPQPSWQIVISAQGQISCRRITRIVTQVIPDFVPVTLSQKSILHHSVLFLHFKKTNDNNMINLMVISDALSRDEFRRLSIACHWLLQRAK